MALSISFRLPTRELDSSAKAVAHGRSRGALEAAALGMQAVDELTAPGGKLPQGLIAADRRADGAPRVCVGCEVGDQSGIDAVGLGADATALAEGDNGVRMNPEWDNVAGSEASHERLLVTPGRLEADDGGGRTSIQPVADSLGCIVQTLHMACAGYGNVDPVLRDIAPHNGLVSHRLLRQARVRVGTPDCHAGVKPNDRSRVRP